ncbi:Putative hemolysin [Loktanella sp. DSM 29012]|nr:Putative hemolysin [Loktanella sp. DSM 29012]
MVQHMDSPARSHVSYATAAQSRAGRTMIKLIENATGRLHLIQRARDYDLEIRQGRNFWEVMVDRYGLSLDAMSGAITDIPANGPLVVVANHPFGILDGLIMGYLLSVRRPDFRILANSVFQDAPDLDRVVLPVNFAQTRDAVKQNLETRAAAIGCLRAGGAIGVFPGGTVSTAARPFMQPLDPGWRRFTARMIVKSSATVVPVYFDGQNSRLFQFASHIHPNLRVALLLKEFRRRTNKPVRIAIGAPIAPARIARYADDAQGMMDFLRTETYALSPRQIAPQAYGFEFEDRYRA